MAGGTQGNSMSKLLRNILSLGAAALMGLSPLAAFAADTSLGIYQTTDRKMDYALTLCGPDLKGLCVKLTAIRGSADIPRTRAYLNKYLGKNVRPTGKNKWAGTVTIQG